MENPGKNRANPIVEFNPINVSKSQIYYSIYKRKDKTKNYIYREMNS